MNAKDELRENIKKWFLIDNDIKQKKKEVSKLNNEKKNITEQLMKIMENNDIDSFNANDGMLLYSKKKVKVSLNKQHIIKCLLEYFDDEDPKMVEKITNYIYESRDTKLRKNIQRKKSDS